jgi:ATP-dependent protease ClpP protease subunit
MSRKSKDFIDLWFDCDIFVPTKTMYMGSAVVSDDGNSGTDAAMAEITLKGLHILDMDRHDTPITIYMNNPGGDEFQGLMIMDAIRRCKSRVKMIGTGEVMSMGSLIIQAADDRIMSPNAKMMIHYGTAMLYGAEAKAQYKWVEESKKFDLFMENLFMERIIVKQPNFKRSKLQSMLHSDTILTAQEALDLNLIDSIEEQN